MSAHANPENPGSGRYRFGFSSTPPPQPSADEPLERSAGSGAMIYIFLLMLLLVAGTYLAPMFGPIYYWIVLILFFLAVFRMMSRRSDADAVAIPPPIPSPNDDVMISQVMDVQRVRRDKGMPVYEGVLRLNAARAFNYLKNAFAQTGKVPLVQQGEGGTVQVLLAPARALAGPTTAINVAVHWALLFATILTATYAGANYVGIDLVREPHRFMAGVPYAFSILLILGFHEMGHYLTARRYGQNVTPPYFIPAPFLLGTFGAFIQLRSPSENRKSLFDVAMAGPYAGLVVAVPALLFGLMLSEARPYVLPHGTSWFYGNNPSSSILLYAIAEVASLGKITPGHTLVLHPIAFAGWIGLVVTALNLIPVGQLDGGHTVHAMFGRKTGQLISSVTMFTLFFVAVFIRREFLMWAILVYFLAGARGMPPLDDVTKIGPGRMAIGALAFVILLLIMLPLPN